MTFQSKKKHKCKSANEQSDSPGFQTTTLVSKTLEFPMKPFKGTKSHLEDCQNHDFTNLRKKRKTGVKLTNESQTKKVKIDDPSMVMSKLEEFSDIWNDCPNVENPKSDFEIVPINNSGKNTFSRHSGNEYDTRIEKTKDLKPTKWQAYDSTRNVQVTDKDNQEYSDYHKSSINFKSKVEIAKTAVNKEPIKILEDGQTKSEKYHSKLAEMKRKKAVQEQSQLHVDQKNIIKKALSSVGKEQVNKKIVFSDAEDNEEEHNIGSEGKTKSKRLFDDDDNPSGSETDFKLKVNSQFDGKKGQKLMELQTKFASDSRFTLDSRFHDSESENDQDEAPPESLNIETEKKRQLEILESIVKQPIRPLSETKKVSGVKRDESLMVRFDPTREDHQKYLLKPQKQLQEQELKDKTKKSKQEIKTHPNDESRPVVSSEKIYAVKEDLKEVLKKENKTDFSLLKLFGSKDEDTNIQQGEIEKVKKLKYVTKNPFRYDSSDSEVEEEEKNEDDKDKDNSFTTTHSIPSWRTTFFFTENDSRLKEAEEFLKLPGEQGGDKEFAEKRKMLKDFIRHKLKNSNRKKDPFKKKLGGGNKKPFHKKKVK